MGFQHLPYDIQETILFIVIDLPIPLCGGFNIFSFPTKDPSESIYWSVERQRCVLRLVCREWRDCVDIKSHRLLHLWDFERYSLPETVLFKAQRIILDLPRHVCGCWTSSCRCGSSDRRWLGGMQNNDTITWGRATWHHLVSRWKTLGSNSKAQALEISIGLGIDILYAKSGVLHFISHMKSIVHLNIDTGVSATFLKTASSLPKLAYLRLILEGNLPFPTNLQFNSLLFLSLMDHSSVYGTDGFNGWGLPQLRHLRLTIRGGDGADSYSFASIAAQLASFQFNCGKSINDEFWTKFSGLVQIHIPYSVRGEFSVPPEDHPLSVIVVPGITRVSNLIFLAKVCDWASRCHGIQTFHFNGVWTSLFSGILPSEIFSIEIEILIQNCTNLVSQFSRLFQGGIKVLDLSGESFEGNLVKVTSDLEKKVAEWKGLQGHTLFRPSLSVI